MIIEKRRKKKLPVWRIAFLMLFAGSLSYFWLTNQNNLRSQTDLVSPVVLAATILPVAVSTDEPLAKISDANLKKIVETNLEGTSGYYAVVIKNLKTGEHFELNPDRVFESASLYKLWVMATVYDQEKSGQLNDNDELTESVQSLNQKFGLDSEVAELTDGMIDYSVHNALEKMITVSDNYTALLLTSKIRLSSVDNFLKQQGFNKSSVGITGDEPATTASDMELFFEKLYQGKLADQEYTQKMLDLLKQQKLNNKIPKELPDNLTIAHKTGELDTVSHDAGIVYSPNGDYIIVIMSDSDNPPAAENRISDISQAVYAYFNKGR